MVKQIVFNPECITGEVEFEGYIRHKVDVTRAFKWVDIPAPALPWMPTTEPDKGETATDERRRPLSE